jgi:hypothetical protein
MESSRAMFFLYPVKKEDFSKKNRIIPVICQNAGGIKGLLRVFFYRPIEG